MWLDHGQFPGPSGRGVRGRGEGDISAHRERRISSRVSFLFRALGRRGSHPPDRFHHAGRDPLSGTGGRAPPRSHHCRLPGATRRIAPRTRSAVATLSRRGPATSSGEVVRRLAFSGERPLPTSGSGCLCSGCQRSRWATLFRERPVTCVCQRPSSWVARAVSRYATTVSARRPAPNCGGTARPS